MIELEINQGIKSNDVERERNKYSPNSKWEKKTISTEKAEKGTKPGETRDKKKKGFNTFNSLCEHTNIVSVQLEVWHS